MKGSFRYVAASMFVALCWALPVLASPAVDVVRVDLNPLIDGAAHSREQFAVNIAHPASTTAQGTWTRKDTNSTWTYSARVPTAISMSFHASSVVLPPSAVLTVTTAQTTSQYVRRDVSRGGLWGRPMPGDTLNFSLTVKSSEADRVRFQIDGLQAGYRGLGGGVPDHPHYQELRKLEAASTTCTENYACHVTPDNEGSANATVALIIGNLYECTGTLLNDTSSDGAPYILTARHCQSGQLGGGNPGAAATVSVFWDAVSACGSTLGSIYSADSISQYGATTVLEQQDIWLIRLDAPPAAVDAFYAGWDASGTPFSGGYTIHHAQGENKQYVAWNGTDLLTRIPGSTLSIAYDSTFWGVVNSVGNLGAGGSGSALFGPNNQAVGSASLAQLISGENSAGVCPASPPPNPTASNVTTLFTALSGLWTSTADRTSSTGSTTLQSILDPIDTGQMTLAGLPTQRFAITTSQTDANTGDTVTLSWNVPGAQTCTAWGGATGDGWAGVQPAAGSLQITNATGGTVNYSLACRTAGQIASGTVAVIWDYIAPQTDLTGARTGPLMLGEAILLNWNANVSPCVATGGNAADGWAGPQPTTGAVSFPLSQTGITQYTLTCGTGQRIATDSVWIDGVAPQVNISSSVIQVTAGTSFWLSWAGNGSGGTCAGSGGSSTDNWAVNNGHIVANGSSLIAETTPGTYTFTLTCTGGGQTSSSSTTVVVTPNPGVISLTAVMPEQQVGTFNILNLLWNGSGNGCAIDYVTNSSQNEAGENQAIVLTGEGSSGAASVSDNVPGLETYTLRCLGLTATATINWVATPTPNSLSVTSSDWAANVAYPISWNSSAGPCVASGGGTGDGWAGPKTASGTQSLSEPQQGTYVFTLVCGSGASATTSQLAVTVPQPFIQVYGLGGGVFAFPYPEAPIEWHSTVGPCTYLDGTTPNSTGIPVPPSGSATPTANTAGVYLFSVTCGTGTNSLYAATLAAVVPAIPTTLTASATSVTVDTPVTLTWKSDGTAICYATGGTGQAPWIGTLSGGSGSAIVTSSTTGTVSYGISCGQAATATVTYAAAPATSADAPTPTVSFSASTASQAPGQSISLTWSSANADSCVASGGAPGDGWSGTLAASGTMPVSESSPGTVSYSITCIGAPPAAAATTTVVIQSSAASGGGSGGGSHGGGGAIDILLVLGLALTLWVRIGAVGVRMARPQPVQHPFREARALHSRGRL
jgi:hypothetical protein